MKETLFDCFNVQGQNLNTIAVKELIYQLNRPIKLARNFTKHSFSPTSVERISAEVIIDLVAALSHIFYTLIGGLIKNFAPFLLLPKGDI